MTKWECGGKCFYIEQCDVDDATIGECARAARQIVDGRAPVVCIDRKINHVCGRFFFGEHKGNAARAPVPYDVRAGQQLLSCGGGMRTECVGNIGKIFDRCAARPRHVQQNFRRRGNDATMHVAILRQHAIRAT